MFPDQWSRRLRYGLCGGQKSFTQKCMLAWIIYGIFFTCRQVLNFVGIQD
uniref:Uncharacterized protein n=1 Tax=Lepeophtheirus salmonis TaxID=72036 RepID=A0A0K2U8B4_LEPSM